METKAIKGNRDESIVTLEAELLNELLEDLVRTRKEMKVTQKDLEEKSGICQTAITRIEKNVNTPQISTMLKLLVPLGKKLKIVDIEE